MIRILLFFIFLTFFSCKGKQDEKAIPMNYSSLSENELRQLVVDSGKISAYKELRIVYLDFRREEILPYSLIMANKYNYQQAYFDTYYCLWNIYDDPTMLDSITQGMALFYLKKAASMGHTQASDILKEEGNIPE